MKVYTCYLSGQISGLLPTYYMMRFNNAEIKVNDLGYEAVNPLKIKRRFSSMNYWVLMLEDLIAVYKCDAIFMIGNFRHSRGAKIELAFAKLLRKKIIYE